MLMYFILVGVAALISTAILSAYMTAVDRIKAELPIMTVVETRAFRAKHRLYYLVSDFLPWEPNNLKIIFSFLSYTIFFIYWVMSVVSVPLTIVIYIAFKIRPFVYEPIVSFFKKRIR